MTGKLSSSHEYSILRICFVNRIIAKVEFKDC